MTNNILHVGSAEKFLPAFINLINNNFDSKNHCFLLSEGMAQDDFANLDIKQSANVLLLSDLTKLGKLKHYFTVLVKMHSADKIILHSLADNTLVKILFCTPWLLKKSYWVIWGNDLYTYQIDKRNRRWKIREFFRRPVIKNMGHLVTYIKGDVELARQWYAAKGVFKEALMYPSNTYQHLELPASIVDKTINIQVGNSANPTNNHMAVFEKLLPFKDHNIRIYVPLSYSDQKNAKKVIATGNIKFGDKFIPLTEFMPFDDYLKFLGSIDIAIFNNSRQQAMGNVITQLGLGKTVYLRSDTTQWQFFKAKGIKVHDIDDFDSLSIDNETDNPAKIKEHFSTNTLLKQLTDLF